MLRHPSTAKCMTLTTYREGKDKRIQEERDNQREEK